MATKERVLSGMRPTGKVHLGNYLGALANWVTMQDGYDCFFFVADWHALTDRNDTEDVPTNTVEMVVDWLGAGLDPERGHARLVAPAHHEARPAAHVQHGGRRLFEQPRGEPLGEVEVVAVRHGDAA